MINELLSECASSWSPCFSCVCFTRIHSHIPFQIQPLTQAVFLSSLRLVEAWLGGLGGAARENLIGLPSSPLTSFVLCLFLSYLHHHVSCFSPPVQTWWHFLCEVPPHLLILAPCLLRREGTWKRRQTLGWGGVGDFREGTDRDDQCFALAAKLFLTMLWLTIC